MKNIRAKGASGEREIIKLFLERMERIEASRGTPFGKTVSSNVKRCSSQQADGGGCDIVGIPGLAIEVKRAETLLVDKWWQQCSDQARSGEMPVLFYRQNRKTWRVRWYLCTSIPHKWLVAETSARDFFEWFEEYYELGLKNGF